MANCTSDPQLCIDNKVTGFPTLIAFRGLGWLETMEKCTRKKIQELAKPVEIEYHGVLLVCDITLLTFKTKVDGKKLTFYTENIVTFKHSDALHY